MRPAATAPQPAPGIVCQAMSDLPPAARPLGPDAQGQWVRRWTSRQWTDVVDAWTTARLAERGHRIVGDAVTYRARFWSVVRCYPSTQGLVWFKETNPGHQFEAGLTAAVARLAPDDVVVPTAVDRDRGWLLSADQGTTLGHSDVEDQSTRCLVVRQLARLQCALLGKLHFSEQQRLIVLPPNAAGSRVRRIATEWSGLPVGHPLRATPSILEQAERAAVTLDSCADSISGSVPLDLELNDVYAANILAQRSTGSLRLRFFDFGNAIWGHPFVTLHVFLETVEEWNETRLSVPHREALYETYLEVWSERLKVEQGVLYADLVAIESLVSVHRLISWLRLVPHADSIELKTRAAIPRKWMARVVGTIE